MRLFAFAVLLALAAPSLASAQRPNTREGFWIGLGVGGGSVGLACDDCDFDRSTGGSGYLRMGGTVSPSLLLGGEVTTWVKQEDGADQGLSYLMFIGQWYPSPTGAFFLKGGLGGMGYKLDNGTDELKANGFAGSLGLGYDIRVGNNFSLTPYMNLLSTMGGIDADFNGTPLFNDAKVSVNLVQVGIGLHWH